MGASACDGDPSAAPVSLPDAILDLSVVSEGVSSITLRFTEVDDGLGAPARYVVEYRPGSATVWIGVAEGTCAQQEEDGVWVRDGAGIGDVAECAVAGLEGVMPYAFRVVPFRGVRGEADLVEGPPSDVVDGHTTAERVETNPPALVLAGAGDTATVAAMAFGEGDEPLPHATFSWQSFDEGVSTVDGSGLVTAIGEGSAKVVATLECCADQSDSVDVAVGSPPVRVELSPDEATLFGVGDTLSLTAVAYDEDDELVATAAFEWTSLDGGVASVSSSGMTTAVSVGSTMVVAALTCCGGLADTTSIDVQAQPDRIVVTPSSVTITGVGNTAQLSAAAYDVNGDPIPDASFEWASLDPSVSTVSASGLVRSVSVGSTVVTASLVCCEGFTEGADIEVENPPVNQQVDFPNYPGGLNVIRNTTWTDHPRHQGQDFDGWSARFPWDPKGTVGNGTDSQGSYIELGYPDGMVDGEDPYTLYMYPLIGSVRRFYVASVERWGPNDGSYDHNGIGTKLWHLDPSFFFMWVTRGGDLDCTNKVHMVTEGIPIDARNLEFLSGYRSEPCLGEGYDEIQISQMPGSRTMALGEVLTFEMYINLDETTGSGRQGTVRWWINNQLVGYAAGLRDQGLNAITAFWYSGTWGGGEADGQVNGNQWRRIYRTVVATQN